MKPHARIFFNIAIVAVIATMTTSCGSQKFSADLYDDIYWNGKNVDDGGSSKGSKGNNSNNSKKSNNKGKGSKNVTPVNAKGAYQKLGIKESKGDNQKLYSAAAAWLGTPYKYGSCSRSQTDCSGFVFQIYKEVFGKTLDRSSSGMLAKNCTKISKSQMKPGDLLFFRTDGAKSKTPNHVALYLKDNKFIHASTSKGVIVSSLNESYYVKSFITVGRVK